MKMNIMTIRTDKPEAEIGLFNDAEQITYYCWEAHRILAETIHSKISEVLDKNSLNLHDLEGFVVYSGPGSFTGLRIGISVANSMAGSLNVPIVGSTTEEWIPVGIQRLMNMENDEIVTPEYGALPNITAQKK